MILHIFPLNHSKSTKVFLSKIVGFFNRSLDLGLSEVAFECVSENTVLDRAPDLGQYQKFDSILSFSTLLWRLRPSIVIFHQLPKIRTRIFIILVSKITHLKVGWFVWGGDLYDNYYYYFAKKTPMSIKDKLVRFVNVSFVDRLISVYGVDDDIVYFKRLYPTASARPYVLYYPAIDADKPKAVPSPTIRNILISHSSSPENRHIEAIDYVVQNCTDSNIYCVLSYGAGSKDYCDLVIKYGNQMLGSRFFAIVDFMPVNQYEDFLASIDCVILFSERQSSIFTSLNILRRGAKLIMDIRFPPYIFFSNIGLKIYDLTIEANNNSVEAIDVVSAKRNIELIEAMWSHNYLSARYKDVFNETKALANEENTD